jgi:hypothetical protein
MRFEWRVIGPQSGGIEEAVNRKASATEVMYRLSAESRTLKEQM